VVAQLEDLRERVLAAPARRNGIRLPRWLDALAGRSPDAPVKGLYLWGGVGRGKTWLMDLFCASLPRGLVRRRHFHRFMHEVHAHLRQLHHHLSPLEHVARAIARDARVLCFDELNVADIADAMMLAGLFTGLFRRGVTLVATSNVPPQELYRGGLQRQRFLPAIALLERHLQVVRLGGSIDYRLRQLTQAGIYLSADAADTRARLQAQPLTRLPTANQHARGAVDNAAGIAAGVDMVNREYVGVFLDRDGVVAALFAHRRKRWCQLGEIVERGAGPDMLVMREHRQSQRIDDRNDGF